MNALKLLVSLILLSSALSCSSEPQARPSTAPEAPPTTAAPIAPQPDPKVGQCRPLEFSQATRSTNVTATVKCRREHTAVTFAVGQLDLLRDGHLVAMDSEQVKAQLDDRCNHQLANWIGGSTQTRQLSRLRAVWFRPNVRQADRGASWYRCDVVAVARDEELARFTGDLRGILDQDGALDTFGMCGNSSPSEKGFTKLICSQPHKWRAVSTYDLSPKAKYLGRKAAAEADTACQDLATARDEPSLKYRWAFQWPTVDEWQSGQRYGWCWLPRPLTRQVLTAPGP